MLSSLQGVDVNGHVRMLDVGRRHTGSVDEQEESTDGESWSRSSSGLTHLLLLNGGEGG